MPKDKKKPSPKSSDQSQGYPYPIKPDPSSILKLSKNKKEWEEIICPICLDPPHNPVSLVCSSHEKGCRLYICNTGPLLSNCLNQFRKTLSSSCPLCRGRIMGEGPASGAHRYMNSRPRVCSQGNCEFNGTYKELMEHARKNHVDPTDEVAGSEGTRPISNLSRRAKISVGYYPRHQLAPRTIFARVC